MLNLPVRSAGVSCCAFVVCLMGVGAIAQPSKAVTPSAVAQTSVPVTALSPVVSDISEPMTRPVPLEMPLETQSTSIEKQRAELDQAADNFNQQRGVDSAIGSDAIAQFLESIPFINDFINESGKFAVGSNLETGTNFPISFDLGDVMGNTGLIVSTDFKVN
jgi:hypothetical protein